MARNVVGIDVGTHAVRAVEVIGADSNRPSIARFAEIPLAASISRAGEVQEPAALTAALKQLWRTGGFGTKSVMLGVGSPRVFARDIELPKMTPQQLKQSLQYHVQDVLPMPAADAVLDFVPLSDGVGQNGPVTNGLLVAAPKSTVLALVNAVRAAGLSPLGVDLMAFALSRAQLRAVAARGTVALVDIGAATTNIAIAVNGVPVFVRMIAMGGDDVTRALTRRRDMTEQAADSTKRALGFRQPGPGATQEQVAAAETINQVVGELLTNIRNTLQYFTSNTPGATIASIVLSGGGARLDGLATGLREYTKIDVGFADISKSIEQRRTLRGVRSQDWDAMTVALGLALGVD